MRWFRRRPPAVAENADDGRAKRVAALYGQFVSPGSLVFDVGANVGDRTAVLVELGARVVAVEPQADCAAVLRERFGEAVTVEQAAVGSALGEAELHVPSAHTIFNLNPVSVERVRERRFSDTRRRPSPSDDHARRAHRRHGVPVCQGRRQGYSSTCFAGLSRAVPALSFEFRLRADRQRLAAVDRLAMLGMDTFNSSRGDPRARARRAGVGANCDQGLPRPDASRRALFRRRVCTPDGAGLTVGSLAVTAILGLNAYHGDAAAALVVDGELVAAVEEERLQPGQALRRLPRARRRAGASPTPGLEPRRPRPRRDRPRPAREPRREGRAHAPDAAEPRAT